MNAEGLKLLRAHFFSLRAVVLICGLVLPTALVLATALVFATGAAAGQALEKPAEQALKPPLIGGLPPLRLERKATGLDPKTGWGAKREFTSITLLPGRGLNTFQITANLPCKGETELLRSPSLDDAAQKLNGQGDDAFGNLNHSFGGAFLIPFTSRAGGELSADKSLVNVVWHGKAIHLPNDYLGHYSVHGLLNMMKADYLRVTHTRDGQTLTAVIHAGDFDGHWLSKTDVHFRIALTGDAVDIEVTATNVGDEPEPMGMGWHPFLRILSGDRAQARVHLPADLYGVVDTIDGRPTGELKPVEGTPKDYRSPLGATMPDASTSINFSKLTRTGGSGDSGKSGDRRGSGESENSIDAWLADPKADYAIRVRGLSPEIRTLHLWSAKGDTFCAIEEQYNYMDAFGAEWKGMDTGLVTLEPHASTTWHVRLELFDPPRVPSGGAVGK
jgi:galactose mutarotase-like enzyme